MSKLQHRLDELAVRRRARPTLVTAPRPAAQDIPAALPGEIVNSDDGPCRRITVPFEALAADHGISAEALARPRQAALRGTTLTLDLRRSFLIDIETGGLAGTPCFLIGVVDLGRWPLVVEQWLAGDYPEEVGVLAQLARVAATRDIWISFNGRSFDEPFVRDRARLTRVALPAARAHFDLLHAARRRWKHELPDCRLVTLEERLLDRHRVGDVPGGDVPALIHHFYRTGNARPLMPVLEHNQLDLLSSTQLLLRLTSPGDTE